MLRDQSLHFLHASVQFVTHWAGFGAGLVVQAWRHAARNAMHFAWHFKPQLLVNLSEAAYAGLNAANANSAQTNKDVFIKPPVCRVIAV